jgi:transposase-like protein
MDISVLVRFTGHTDSTLLRWLTRAGQHSQRLPYLQLDELHAPVAGNRRRSWLWLAFEPVSKLIPALHLGARSKADAYYFLHDLRLRLAPTCIPAITTDGLRAYFYAITAHFGQWVADRWVLDPQLAYGQPGQAAREAKG